MSFLVRIASTYTATEQEYMGITGIPASWPIYTYPYVSGEIPENYVLMTELELTALKVANQTAYDVWALTKVVVPPTCVYSYATSTSLSATTSTEWQTKILLTTESMVEGEYNISWSYAWYYTSKQRNFNAQVILDATTVHTLIKEPSNASSSQRNNISGFLPVTIEEGIHTVILNYKSSNSSDEAGIENAAVELLKKDKVKNGIN